MQRKFVGLIVLGVLCLGMVGACAPLTPPQSEPLPIPAPATVAPATIAPAGTAVPSPTSPATFDAPSTPAPTTVPIASPALPTPEPGQNLKGQHVRVLGVWSGVEFDAFQQVVRAWEVQTGGKVDWEGARNLSALLPQRLKSGNAPDIAVLPNPGLMQELARQGKLVPLDSFMDMEQLAKDYTTPWLALGSYDGKLYSFFYRAHNRETVWYNPQAFRAGGYTPPGTWDEWIALADKMVADGKTPFSIATESGPGTGWSLTDWIAEIVLHHCGPEIYDQWVAHRIPWTDACIKESFRMFGTIVGTKGYVLGGAEGIVANNVDKGGFAMYTTPPQAYMDYLSSFEQSIITTRYPDLEPVSGYNYFPFPTINPQFKGAVTIGADALVLFNPTPAARSFMSFMAGAPAQSIWVKYGGFLALNHGVPLTAYPDPVSRAVAMDLTSAKVIRFGAGDSMPAEMQQAWWKQMVRFVRHPEQLDAILDALEATAQAVYP